MFLFTITVLLLIMQQEIFVGLWRYKNTISMAYKQLKLWFDKDLAQMLATKITAQEPFFPSKDFITSIEQKVDGLELKDRVETIADSLYKHLNQDFETGIDIL